MDVRIEERLRNPKIESQQDLKSFVKITQSMIAKYEQELYSKDAFSEEELHKIRNWRTVLFEIIKKNKESPEDKEEDSHENEGFNVLRLLNRQLSLADSNQKILGTSTLKLMGLDYSSNEIEKAIKDTRKKLENTKRKEREERKHLFFAFLFFVGVCIYILVDKIRIKFL